MTAHQLMIKKVTTATEPLGSGVWRTVCTFDWRTPSGWSASSTRPCRRRGNWPS
jgi:hypothetical protein